MDMLALILSIIGSINWGLVGIFKFDLVAWIFGGQTAVVSRIGEPIQADAEIIAGLEDAQIVAGAEVELRVSAGGVRLVGPSGDPVVLADDVARHLFVQR